MVNLLKNNYVNGGVESMVAMPVDDGVPAYTTTFDSINK